MKPASLLIGIGVLLLAIAFLGGCSFGGDAAEATPTPGSIPDPDAPVVPADTTEVVALPGGDFTPAAGAAVHLEPFSIYKTEVTNEMYAACAAAGACFPQQGEAAAGDAAAPALGIDHNMAAAYCAWAGGRLPTEAEWEYAAASGEARRYPWGDAEADCEKANYSGCQDPAAPLPVGSLPAGASPLGVLDLAGNAWEWVYDWYSPDGVTPPVGPASGVFKVLRGGAYDSTAGRLLLTSRHAGNPYIAYSNVGFRCVLAPELELPAGYAATDTTLHVVPGGYAAVDLLDPALGLAGPTDPGLPGLALDTLAISPQALGCPDPAGALHFNARVLASAPLGAAAFTLNGAAYTCEALTPAGMLDCHGAVPPDDGAAAYAGELCLTAGDASRCFALSLTKPAGCDGIASPFSLKAYDGCGAGDGTVPFTVQYHPDITWTSITPVPPVTVDCSHTVPGTLVCAAKGLTHDTNLTLQMEGVLGGVTFHAAPTVFLRLDCAAAGSGTPGSGTPGGGTPGIGTPGSGTPGIGPAGKPAVLISYWACAAPAAPVLHVLHKAAPGGSGVLETVALDGSLLSCTSSSATASTCAVDAALAGSSLELLLCMDGACETSTVTVPTCPPTGGTPGAGGSMVAYESCAAGEKQVNLFFLPALWEAPGSVTADGAALNCTPSPSDPARFTCLGLPAAASSTGTIAVEVTFASSAALSETITDLDCTQTPDLDPSFWADGWMSCEPGGSGLTEFMANIEPDEVAVDDVTLNGAALSGSSFCDTWEGFVICENIPSPAGQPADFKMCNSEGGETFCFTAHETFPDCSGGAPGATGVQMTFLCEPGEGSSMLFTFSPDAPAAVASVSANGQELTCTAAAGGLKCTDLPGAAGEMLRIVITYADGSSQNLFTTLGACNYDMGSAILTVVSCQPGTTDEVRIITYCPSLLVITEYLLNGSLPENCTVGSSEVTCRNMPIMPQPYDLYVCLDSGFCTNQSINFPPCAPAPEEQCGWTAVSSYCEDNRMQFRLINTCQDETLAMDSVEASDGSQEYECITSSMAHHSTCFGWRPTVVPYDMTIAYRLTSDPETTRYATIPRLDWAAALPYCEPAEAPTQAPTQPPPTQAPPTQAPPTPIPPTPVPPTPIPPTPIPPTPVPVICTGLTEIMCNTTNGCYWHKGVAAGLGYCSNTP